MFSVFFSLFSPENSGVATLSITDSSATSSEDALNPDSPDNPAINNDLLQQSYGSKRLKVPRNNNNTNHTKNKQVLIQFLFAFTTSHSIVMCHSN